MRNRSHSICLDEDEEEKVNNLGKHVHVSPQIQTKEMFTEFKESNHLPHTKLMKNRRQSLIVIDKFNVKSNVEKEALFQRWQENEIEIILKAYKESVKEGDTKRALSLKVTLLELSNSKKDYDVTESLYELPEDSMLVNVSPNNFSFNAKSLTTSVFSKTDENQIQRMIEQNINQYDKIFIGTVIGDPHTGKSILINKLLSIKDIPIYKSKFGGIESKSKIITENNIRTKYILYESSTSKNEAQIKLIYFNKSSIIVIMFDKSRRNTFDSAIEWVKKMRDEYGIGTKKILLVGNLSNAKAKVDVNPTMFLKRVANLNVNYYEYFSFTKIKESELRRCILLTDSEKDLNIMKSKSTKMKNLHNNNSLFENQQYCTCNIF